MTTAALLNRENEYQQSGKPTGPCVMVLFGGAGDLTKRKLVPALFNLVKAKLLSDNFAIIGISVDDLSLEQFRNQVTGFLQPEDRGNQAWQWFTQRLYYERGDFADLNTYSVLGNRLSDLDRERHTAGNYLFYLATAPTFFAPIVQQLSRAGLSKEENGRWRRVVIEKPFGHDLESAKFLNRQIRGVLSENQIYRIDHYLGKETVQNIMVFRFDNAIFEPIWNRRYIDHVEITNAETVGVEQRGGYFDTAGTLRDMVPNHMMQLLTLIAMESPISFHADGVRHEQAKVPGAVLRVGSVDMSFEYSRYFGADAYTGYEVLLYDCMIGDPTLFQRADMVEAGWTVVDPVLDVWKALPPRRFPNYAAGTWGPRDADELMERDQRQWRKIDP